MNLRYYLQKLILKLLGQDRIILDVLPWGDRFVLNLERAVDRQIYLRRFEPMETKVVSALVERGGVCIDVGANIGYYTALMARCAGHGGCVVAFEPGRQIRPWLRVNLEMNNHIENVIVLNKAVSNIESSVVFYECEDPAYSSTLEGATDYVSERRRYDVETTRLDDVVAELGYMQKVSIIKIDVEGGESPVIEGAWKLLAESRPILMVEYFHLNLRGQSGDKSEFIKRLLDTDYKGFVLDKKRHRIVEFTEPSVEGNLIFIHATQPEKIEALKCLNL